METFSTAGKMDDLTDWPFEASEMAGEVHLKRADQPLEASVRDSEAWVHLKRADQPLEASLRNSEAWVHLKRADQPLEASVMAREVHLKRADQPLEASVMASEVHLKIAILGDSYTGRTSILRRFLHDTYTDLYVTKPRGELCNCVPANSENNLCILECRPLLRREDNPNWREKREAPSMVDYTVHEN